jgi:hypothetical protein
VKELGVDGTRELAVETEESARGRLAGIDADTSVLDLLVDELAARTES